MKKFGAMCVAFFATVFFASVILACSNDAGGGGESGGGTVCTYVQSDKSANYYVFYSDGTAEGHSNGTDYAKGILSYSGNPTKNGEMVTLKIASSGTTLFTFKVTVSGTTITAEAYLGGMATGTKYNVKTGSSTDGSESGKTDASGGGSASSGAICTYVQSDDATTYYIFYADNTVEYYYKGKLDKDRSTLTYSGRPTENGETVSLKIAATGTELITFKVTVTGSTITAQGYLGNFPATKYNVSSGSASGGGSENSTSLPSNNSSVAPYAVSFDLTGSGGCADKIKAITGTTKARTAITDDAICLEKDITFVEDADTGIKLTLLASASTKIGSIQNYSTSGKPYYKYTAPAAGIIFKQAGFLISGVKGKAIVIVEWAINSNQTANDRYMAMAVGTNNAVYEGNVDTSSASNAKSVIQTALVDAYDFGTAGGEIVIGATNELGIKSITIKTVDSVESVISPNKRSENSGGTSENNSGATNPSDTTETNTDDLCVWVAYGDNSNYYIFYDDGTAEYYAGYALNFSRSVLTYTGKPNAAGTVKITNKNTVPILIAAGAGTLTFTVKKSGADLIATESNSGLRYIVTTSIPSSGGNSSGGDTSIEPENPSTTPTLYSMTVSTSDAEAGIIYIDNCVVYDGTYMQYAGETIGITITANDGYEFYSLSVMGDNGKEISYEEISHESRYRFTMPESAVTVLVYFRAINGDAEVCRWEQNDNSSNYFVFYADKTVDFYVNGNLRYARSSYKYTGKPTSSGTVTIETNTGNTIFTFYVSQNYESIYATEKNFGTKFVRTGNAIVCRWVQNKQSSTYYVFYADNTVGKYEEGSLALSRENLRYEGNPTEAGSWLRITDASGTTLFEFTISNDGGTAVENIFSTIFWIYSD